MWLRFPPLVRLNSTLASCKMSLRKSTRRPSKPRKPSRLFKTPARLELLERRLLLTGNDAMALHDLGDDAADAQQAALVDFMGPDLVGKDGPMARIGMDLDLLSEEFNINQTRHPGTPFTPSNSLELVAGNQVFVDVVSSGQPSVARSQLNSLGMT